MTVAVCLECGEIKHGAFTPCRVCGFEPSTGAELAKHLLVSTHHMSRAELKGVSELVNSGEEIYFPPELLEAHLCDPRIFARFEASCLFGCVSFLLAIIAFCGYVIYKTYF